MASFAIICYGKKEDHKGNEFYSFEARSDMHKLCTLDFTVSTVEDGMKLLSGSKDFHNELSRSEREEIVAEARKMILEDC